MSIYKDIDDNTDFINLIKNNYANETRSIKIVDYGGANGEHKKIIEHVFPNLTFDYSIIDFNSKVEHYKYIYEAMDDGVSNIDIFHSNAAIQYSNYIDRDFINIGRLDPKFILLLRTPITENDIYLTIQHFEGTHRYWFFNINYIQEKLPRYRNVYCNTRSFPNITQAKYMFPEIPEDELIMANMLFERITK